MTATGSPTQDEIYENLCTYDPRSPYYADLAMALEDDMRQPRQNCCCDNCFYGRDRLALEILRLRALQ